MDIARLDFVSNFVNRNAIKASWVALLLGFTTGNIAVIASNLPDDKTEYSAQSLGANSGGSTLRLQAHTEDADWNKEELFVSLVMSDPAIPLIVKAALPNLVKNCRDQRKRRIAWYQLKCDDLLWIESTTLKKVEDYAAACKLSLTCLSNEQNALLASLKSEKIVLEGAGHDL